MKQRVITALIFGIVFIGAMLLMNTIVFPAFVALLSAMAVWEIEKAVGLSNKMIAAASLAVSVAIPFITHFGVSFSVAPFGCLYVVLTFIFMLLKFETTKFEQAVIALFASVCVPFSFSLMIVFRDIYKYFDGYTKIDGIFLLVLSFFAAWMTDIFAYFVGSKFGKHKLCPKISPKKTVEGAIGGVIFCIISAVIIWVLFQNIFMPQLKFNFFGLLILAVLNAVISIIGDLSFSLIKRSLDIKDYSSIFPGHGGMLDRFDSIIFTAPVMLAIDSFMPFVTMG